MLPVDLYTPEYDALLTNAPLYRKTVRVSAEQVTSRTRVSTVLADGTVETEHTAVHGDFIITNPGGERYVISATKFYKRYAPTETDGVYQAVGQVRAVLNPTGVPVVIQAPWGDPQIGDAHCMFAVSVEVPTDRYIIGGVEFAETYAPA